MSEQRRIRLGVFTCAVVPLLVLTIVSGQLLRNQTKSQNRERLIELAQSKSDQMERLLRAQHEKLDLVTSRTQMRLSLDAWNSSADPQHQQRITRIIQDANASVADFKLIWISTLDGDLVSHTQPTGVPNQKMVKSVAEQLKLSKAANVQRLHLVEDGYRLMIGAYLLVDDRRIGVIGVQLELRDLTEITLAVNTPSITETTRFVSWEFDQPRQIIPAQSEEASDWLASLASHHASDEIAFLEGFVDDTNRRSFAVFTNIPGTPWSILVQTNEQSVLAAVHRETRLSLFVLITAIALALIIGRSISNRLCESVQFISHHIDQTAGSISAATRLPEEISSDFLPLAKSYNLMLDRVEAAEHQLKEHNEILEAFHRIVVGRELRMIELKEQINFMAKQLGEPEPFQDLNDTVAEIQV